MNLVRSTIAWLARTWLASLHFRGELAKTNVPVVYCVWHRDLPAAGALLRHQPVTSLVSASQDGDLLIQILAGGQMDFTRGSDSRRALSGTRVLLRQLRRGRSVATTWDGPKGPEGIRKPGPAWLSKHSGAPLVELRFRYGRHLRLGDWSRLRLPLPWSTVWVETTR